MNKRNTAIQKSLLLLFLIHLMVCPAIHEYQDLIETEILSTTPIFENLHPSDLVANRESKFQHFDLLNAGFFVMPLLVNNPLQQAPYSSFSSLSSSQQAASLRC